MKHIFLAIAILFLVSCKKEELPCINFPCNGTDDKLVNYNRVAYDPLFRIGTWINVRASASSPDTIIFYNEQIWSNFYLRESTNQIEGIFNKNYKFVGLYLEFNDGYDGNPLPQPVRKQTYYDDSTGIFSILQQQGTNGFQQWDHYIKVQ